VSAAMELNLSGHPLHTRLQTVAARRDAAGTVVVEAGHLDLRKRGFVPVGADLQASGIVHDMSLRATLDPQLACLRDVETAMRTPAFERSELTRGETCRDVAGRHPALESLPLDGGTSRAIAGAMNGVRGCSHILALTQLAASTIRYALDGDTGWDRGPERRLFHRTLVIDGSQPADRVIEIAVQLNDLFFAPAAPVANPMDRFARQYELRLLARIDLDGVVVRGLELAERRRGREDLDTAGWRRRDADVAGLLAAPFFGGFAARVFAHFPQPERDRPLIDGLLALAPAFIQICACFSEDWPSRCMAVDTLVGIGGIPDACYMWRRDGALHASRKRSDPLGKVGD